jgi:hypothetical protein
MKVKFRRRKYNDGTVIIYTKEQGAILTTTEEHSEMILKALNQQVNQLNK